MEVTVDGVSAVFEQAVTAHCEAVAHARRADDLLRGVARQLDDGQSAGEQSQIAAELATAASALLPGWLGMPLDGSVSPRPLGRDAPVTGPVPLRLGDATPAEDAHFPVLIPLLGAGHLAVDVDARDGRVSGLLRSVLLRLLAACPAGTVRVLPVDGGTVGATFAPFQPLVEAGVMPAPATDTEGFTRVLEAAERHVRQARSGGPDLPYLLLLVASLPPQSFRSGIARLAALTHAGPESKVHLVFCGYPSGQHSAHLRPPPVEHTAVLRLAEGPGWLGNPAGEPYGEHGLNSPIRVDPAPAPTLVGTVCEQLADLERAAQALRFADLIPTTPQRESSVTGLRTAIGRAGRQVVELAFDDATPHWLVGGRTGSGKTVFLLDVLYGLAARYSPDELALYLLDFKEGVSFTEFSPTDLDPTWIPHARAVGIESDREYGVAVLRELVLEMTRRSTALKRAGVTKLADLRRRRADVAMPRILAVIDEFHVLFAGNDKLAAEAVALLEDLARKGRSYGVHLILSSQTSSGIEALYTKTESIFGQFPMRVALAGGGNVLHPTNNAADGLPIGTAVVNDAGGVPDHNRLVRFPDAHAEEETLAETRQWMWRQRRPGSHPPAVFQGFAEQRVEDDPGYTSLAPGGRHRFLLVGRNVDVVSSTARFGLDATPGRHLAALGPSPVGADILHAATLGLCRQHNPGTARFVVASLVDSAEAVAAELVAALGAAGHSVDEVDAPGLRTEFAKLAETSGDGPAHTYLVGFGMDAAAGVLTQAPGDLDRKRSGRADLQTVLAQGPASGVHLLGWWRAMQRFSDDIGGARMRENVACLVALNVPPQALGSHIGVPT
ncbi:MAG TPA: FtsK/SpoIIIE domain-containing protein, partial [Micromonosporaceae bacterium]|nr:FtsK/SpoIIIE domain-containing protein [Micromonosporaceae bacterium]